MKIHSRLIFRQRRKDLRNNATAQETILWEGLKKSGLGFKFQRQHSIGPYIVDFYCPTKKLVIEVDGSSHTDKDAKLYDADRTNYFEILGLKVLRFWNSEVDADPERVFDKISSFLSLF